MGTLFSNRSAAPRFVRRRDQAITVAAEVFAEKGYLGASTQEIAARLGIQQASLYHYFSSKEEALEEVCLLATRGALQQLETLLAHETSSADTLRAVVHRQLYGVEIGCHALIVHHEQRHHLTPERLARVRGPSARYRALLTQTIARGMQRGELRPDLDAALAARTLLGLCHSVASWYARNPGIDLDRVANHHADLFLNGARLTTPASPQPPVLAGAGSRLEL